MRLRNFNFQNPACVGRGNGVYSFPVKLTARQIERLVKQGEVVHTECKDASGGLPDSLWESYSSFANTDGGVILLGVKEVGRKFSIAGVPKAATLIKRFWDGVNNREKVSVNILFDRHVYSVKCRGRGGRNQRCAQFAHLQYLRPCRHRRTLRYGPCRSLRTLEKVRFTRAGHRGRVRSRPGQDHRLHGFRPRSDQDPSKPRPIGPRFPKSAPKGH